MLEWQMNLQMKRQRRQVPCTIAKGRVASLKQTSCSTSRLSPPPPRAGKWIVKARPQKLTPDPHCTSWLRVFAFN